MKKKRNALIQLAILTALGAAMVLSSILPRLPSSNAESEPLAVSVVVRDADSSLWSNARLGMEQAAGELRAELRFLTMSQANDGEGQLQMLRWESEQGADALVVVPADPEGLAAALSAGEVGCPVVCMESEMWSAAPSVVPDNAALGRELAMAALEDWRGGPFLLMDGAPPGSGPAVRAEAARQALLQAGVPVRLQTVGAEDSLRRLLEETDAAGVIVFEPAFTEQAAALKESLGLSMPLYGVGATASIIACLERGTVAAAAVWSDFAVGYLAVKTAVSKAQGQDMPAEELPFFVVRGEEIYDAKYQKLLFPVTS